MVLFCARCLPSDGGVPGARAALIPAAAAEAATSTAVTAPCTTVAEAPIAAPISAAVVIGDEKSANSYIHLKSPMRLCGHPVRSRAFAATIVSPRRHSRQLQQNLI